MSKGPRIDKEVRLLITQRAIENLNKPRGDVAIELQNEIRRKGYPVPEHKTLERYISNDRKHPQSDEDQPWTLAVSADYGIAREALPMLLRLWKLDFINDGDFTIRKAKWAARLEPAFDDEDSLRLWSKDYAIRERICEIKNQEFYTSDLDASLVMDPWELATAGFVGKVHSDWVFTLKQIIITSSSWPTPARIESWGRESFINIALDVCTMDIFEPPGVPGHEEFLESVKTLYGVFGWSGEYTEVKIPDEAKSVYSLWLRYLAKGQKWQYLTVEKRGQIAKQLKEWIENHPWTKSREGLPRRYEEVIESPLFKPTELLRKVGYDV
ncbi:hypothetical protein ACFLXA_06100 [Chloroflexota bacterium]